MKSKISGLILPALFVLAWIFALTGVVPSGGYASEPKPIAAILWLLFMAGIVFIASSIMHSIFAKSMAESIGWKTNGFQYEIAAVSLGLGIGCFYATGHSPETWVAISLPIITFLFFAGLNHLKEVIKDKNYAPNNLLILIWDFGVSISLLALMPTRLHQHLVLSH